MNALTVALVEVTDADFEWMLYGCHVRSGLRLPDGGPDDPAFF